MSDADLPKLPQADEPKRANPLVRYLTQQLTRVVPQAQIESASQESMTPQTAPSTGSFWSSRRGRWSIAIGAAALIVIIAAVSGSGDTNAAVNAFSSDGAGDGDDWVEGQIAAWRAADLEPGGFAEVDATALGAAECFGGAAEAIELTLCRFTSAAGAAKAVRAAEASIGKHTGLVLAEGDRLLVLADRRSADPSGKTINRIAKGFKTR